MKTARSLISAHIKQLLFGILGASSFWAAALLGYSKLLGVSAPDKDHLLAMSGVFFAVILIGLLGKRLGERALFAIGVSLCISGALTMVLSSPGMTGFDNEFLYIGSRGIMWAGSPVLLIAWGGGYFAAIEPKLKSSFIGATCALSVFFFLVVLTLPAEIATVAYVLLSGLSILRFFDSKPLLSSVELAELKTISLPWKIRAVYLSFGLILGFLFKLTSSLPLFRHSVDPLHQISTLVFASISLLTAFFFLLKPEVLSRSALQKINVLPIILLGLLFPPLLIRGGLAALPSAVITFGLLCLSLILIVGPAYARAQIRIGNLVFLFWEHSIPMVTIVTGYLLASFALPEFFQSELITVVVLAVVSYVIVLLAFFVFFVSPMHFFTQQNTLKHENNEEHLFQTKCKRIAEKYGLTPRESEVFALLAKGRSLPYVEKTLVIAAGTARAHAVGIYRKLAIHNRQELLDLFDSENGCSG